VFRIETLLGGCLVSVTGVEQIAKGRKFFQGLGKRFKCSVHSLVGLFQLETFIQYLAGAKATDLIVFFCPTS